jgi:hypothetical protein
MKFDPQKSFGYPVLRPGSQDYLHSDFQSGTSLEVNGASASSYILSYDIALGVKELSALVAEGKAKALIEVACRTTFFGRVYELQNLQGKIELDAAALRGALTISCYVISTKAIKGFASKKINPEFGDEPLSFPPFAVLACDSPAHYWVDRELFRNITSIFDYRQDEKLSEGEWRLNLDEDRVEIVVSPTQLSILQLAQSDKANQAVIINSLVFGAVIEMVSILKSSTEFDEKRWALNVRGKCASLGIHLTEASSAIEVAQKLMGRPLNRLNAQIFKAD